MGSFIQLGDNDLTKEINIAELGDQKFDFLKMQMTGIVEVSIVASSQELWKKTLYRDLCFKPFTKSFETNTVHLYQFLMID